MMVFGGILTLLGACFLLLGALGIVRMPDVYNRMQAGTKATTLGTLLFLVGIAIGHIECMCVYKIIILILFIIFTNPISSHTLARAAHHIGIPLTDKSVTDALADDKIEKEEVAQ